MFCRKVKEWKGIHTTLYLQGAYLAVHWEIGQVHAAHGCYRQPGQTIERHFIIQHWIQSLMVYVKWDAFLRPVSLSKFPQHRLSDLPFLYWLNW